MKASDFLHWWRSQLSELMPAALRGSWQDAKTRLVLRIDGNSVELRSPAPGPAARIELPESGDAARPATVDDFLSQLRGRPQRVSLVLAANAYLLRRLTLPRAAQANLAEAVGYQLPQLTPFTASQLIYACGETPDSPAEGPISVWLVAVPRQRVARALALIDQAPPDGYLALRQPPAAGEDVELTWRLPEASSFSQHRVRLAWLGLLGLWLGVLGLHLYHQQQAQTRLDEALDELRARAHEVGNLRDRLAVAKAQADRLTALKQSAHSPLVLLDALTEQLDDQTWLQGFDLRGGGLTLRGITTSPATLIETLEASAMLQDVRFDAAITRDRRSQGDRFNINAKLESPAPEGSS
jgi:general secretion pathway protein L